MAFQIIYILTILVTLCKVNFTRVVLLVIMNDYIFSILVVAKIIVSNLLVRKSNVNVSDCFPLSYILLLN